MSTSTEQVKYKSTDFKSDAEPRWCPGCEDYAILKAVQTAMAKIGRPTHEHAVVSGIGCSSRFPYYMSTYGFHTIHGRAPTVATGVKVANPELSVWMITGDGDGLSIGANHLLHLLRRNLDINVLLFNNRIYGLTKGQYSATADIGSKKKKGMVNETQPIDLCALAINLGCSFVARSFSGSKKQLTAIVKAAMSHKGFALIDVISPCVTFNNNDESLKSYGYVKGNTSELHSVGYIPHFSPVEQVEVPAGSYRDITLHDGSTMRLETISDEHDISDAVAALAAIHEAEAERKHVMGLLYFDGEKPALDDELNLHDTPLVEMQEDMLRPSKEDLDGVIASLRG